MKTLYDELFKDYSSELRPVFNESETLTVAVQFWLKQILKIDERDQTLNVYCWLELVSFRKIRAAGRATQKHP